MTPRPRTDARAAVVALALCGALGACSHPASAPPGPAGRTTHPVSPISPTSPISPGRPSGTVRPVVDKLLVVMVENHSLDQMRTQMPFTFGLAQDYGYATHYRAVTHPSLGNYVAIATGSSSGIVDDRNPVAHRLPGPTVFSQALDAGRTTTVYAEGMAGTCADTNGGDRYVVRHNPWTYVPAERDVCDRYDVSADRLAPDAAAGDLPTVAMVVPNLCDDAHDCPLSDADDWLHRTLDGLMAGPDWRSGRLAIVVTADEDDHHQDNTVLTTVLHPSLEHRVVSQPLTHLSLSRALSEVAGAPPLRDAAGAPSLLDAFGLRVAR